MSHQQHTPVHHLANSDSLLFASIHRQGHGRPRALQGAGADVLPKRKLRRRSVRCHTACKCTRFDLDRSLRIHSRSIPLSFPSNHSRKPKHGSASYKDKPIPMSSSLSPATRPTWHQRDAVCPKKRQNDTHKKRTSCSSRHQQRTRRMYRNSSPCSHVNSP